jgi:hypothetical protein
MVHLHIGADACVRQEYHGSGMYECGTVEENSRLQDMPYPSGMPLV